MKNNKGFTLIELLVAMGMAGIVMAAIFMSYKAQVQGKIAQEVTLEMQQSGRAGLERIESDIRMAGCDPSWDAGAGFLTAAADETRFTMDISGGGGSGNEFNGVIDQPVEDVRYALVDGNLVRERMLAEDGAGNPEGEQPLIRNVDALNFVYLDINGAVTAVLADIRSVEVSIVIRGGEGAQSRGLMRASIDNTSYENQQGDEILPPPGDEFRRIQLTTTVHCRNMGRS